MVTMRNPFKRQDSVDATTAPELHHTASAEDVKSPVDEKDGFVDSNVAHTHDVHGHNPWEDAGEENRLANGKERPIEVSRVQEDLLRRLLLLTDALDRPTTDGRGHRNSLYLARG